MDVDDSLPRKTNDPVAQLVLQDIDRLSVDELQHRVAALEGEIMRCRKRMDAAVNHRASADGLFKR